MGLAEAGELVPQQPIDFPPAIWRNLLNRRARGVIYGILQDRLSRAMELTDALASEVTAESLALHNATGRSNTIGEQFWCLVGARESYARAFEHGIWRGFSCSLNTSGVHDPEAVRSALEHSNTLVQVQIRSIPDARVDESRISILFDLEQNEVHLHGQLIRYFYANVLPFPTGFAKRYSL